MENEKYQNNTIKNCEECQNEKCLNNKKNQDKFTTTKKVLWLSWIIFLILVFLEVAGYTLDTPIEIIGGIMTTIITSVYLWKARAENKLKISMSVINDLADKYGIENIICILSQIVGD